MVQENRTQWVIFMKKQQNQFLFQFVAASKLQAWVWLKAHFLTFVFYSPHCGFVYENQ